ncbi:MAG: hypothetical protein RL699_1665 [Bacteroidota bacterium]|jgi:hypothetical protein
MKKTLNISYNSSHFRALLSLILLIITSSLSAQVTTLSSWTNAYHGTADASATVTLPTGTNSNRLLVVAIASSQTAVGARTATVAYGGQTLTLAAGDMTLATTRQHTALYYLNEAGLDAATSTALAVTFGGGTTRVNDVWTAVYDYVDQTTALTNTQSFNSLATTNNAFAFATALTVNANDQAIEVISTIRNGNTTPRTITAATNWTSSNEQTFNTIDGVRNGVFTRSISTTNTTDTSAFTTSGNVLASMTGISIKGILHSEITAFSTWSNLYHGTANFTSLVGFTTAASTKKVFVVAIATSQTAVGARTATVTYGGQAMTLATGDLSDATVRQHTALYYLDNAGLSAASSSELAVSISGGTTRVNDVWGAIYDNIDQCSPIADSKNFNGGTTAVSTLAFATGLTVNPNDKAIEVLSSVRSANTTPRTLTAATNWTSNNEQTFTTTDGVRNAVLSRSIPIVLATDVSSATLSGTALASMSAISLKAAQTTLTITGGGSVCTTTTLNVTNSGTGTVYFQGTTSGGTSTATPSTSEVITTSGTYYFRAQNALGCWGEEASVTVVVNPSVTADVSIASSDADNIICEGTSVTFTATPTNGGTPTYQWIKNGVDIVGATGATYSTTTLANTDSIQVRMTSTAACVTNSPITSSSIQTTVVSTVAPVAQDQTFCAGSTVANLVATGSSIAWYASATGGAALASSAVLTSANYFATQVENGCESASRTQIAVVVNPTTSSVVIVSDDADNSICAGTAVTFTATPTNGGTSPSYQWKKNGIDIASETNPTLNTSGLVNGDQITVQMTSNAVCVVTPATSNAISTTVIDLPQVSAVSICAGGTGSFTATAICNAITGLTSGAKDAGTAVNATGVGTVAWGTPGNITAAGTPYATMSVAANATTNYLRATNYGFTIPANATIQGISVSINKSSSGTTSPFLRDNVVSLVKAGTIQTTNKALTGTNWSNSGLAVVNYGGAADLWATTWTPADLNNANFGVVLAASNSNANARTATVDYIRVTVSYSIEGSLDWYTVSSGGSAIATGSTFNPVGVAGSGLTNTNTSGVTPYYVACRTTGCRTQANFEIKATPNAPVGTNMSRCGEGVVTLEATVGNDETIDWYDAAVGGNLLASSTATFTTSSLSASTTFYAEARNSITGCVSNSRTAIEATIVTPQTPTVSIVSSLANTTVCAGESISFTATPVLGGLTPAYIWKVNGNAVAETSAVFTSSSLQNNDSVSVEMTSSSAACLATTVANSNQLTVVVTPLSNAGTASAAQLICAGTSTTVSISGSQGTIQWQQADPTVQLWTNVTDGSGATTTTYTTGIITAPILYRAVVTNGVCASANSAEIAITILGTYSFYVDADGDGVGSASANLVCSTSSSDVPSGYALTNTDCDDTDALVWRSSDLYVDADNDGYSLTANTTSVCYGSTVPAGYLASTLGVDCNDTDASVWRSAALYVDADNDGYSLSADATATVCYGSTVPTGYLASTLGVDCDDTDASVWRSAALYVDADNDGYSLSADATATVCYGSTVPAGYLASTLGVDCNDNDASVWRSAALYVDVDNDGYSLSADASVTVCYGSTVPAGYLASTLGVDCNDSDASVWRSAALYVDADNDGYAATEETTTTICYGANVPQGYVVVSLGLDCNDTVAAINPGQSEILYNGIDDNCDGQLDEGFQLTSALQAATCGQTLSTMGSLVYADINLNATAYRFKVVNNTTGEIQYVDNTHYWFALNWLASYDYATAYTVSVQLQIAGLWVGYYGTACVVNSPAITDPTGSLQLVSTQCGAVLPSIGTIIYTTAQSGATGYRFRITDVTPNATGANLVQVKERSYHWFGLTMLPRYNYGSTYMVEVAVKTTGGYTGYGSPCYINTPASPMLNNCGAVIPTSRTLVYTAITKSVTQYRFQVTKVSDQSSRTFDTGRFWFSFKVNMPGYTPSVAYSVRVAVMTAGTWSPFGDACEIISPAIPRTDGDAELDFSANAFPNPYTDQFNLQVNTDSDERISYKVYDMLGKLIEADEFEYTALETKEFGRNYPAGVYNIIVSQGEERKTLRIIKR